MKKPSKKSKNNKQSNKILFLLIAIFAVIGAGAWCAYSFASNNVTQQLSEQKIFFPEKGSKALDPSVYPDLQKYGGQQVDNGEKAKAYADGYIKRHLSKIAEGKTYSEVSSEYLKNPKDEKLAEQRTSLFMGTTLRGLLLNAYAFGVIANIAMYAAYASFAIAGFFGLLFLRNKFM